MPKLGGAAPTPNTDTVLYTAPNNKRATISVNVCNTNQNNGFIYLALCASGSTIISTTDYIEFNTNLAPGNTLERTSLTPANGERILCRTNIQGIVFVVWGYEES